MGLDNNLVVNRKGYVVVVAHSRFRQAGEVINPTGIAVVAYQQRSHF